MTDQTAVFAVQPTLLLDWYRTARRDLPWRAPPGQLANPYAVLVSELMLQQTRVQTVLDYFARWMARWPTLEALAAATEADVLAMWTGLGYYNRARNLYKAAQLVAAAGGSLPSDAAALRALPGLGPYTVGAVRSIGFGLPAALVDGNVARVLARWLALPDDPMVGKGRDAVWHFAEALLAQDGPARRDPASWNQALMELGATVCTPRQPDCAQCPAAAFCAAALRGQTAQIPPPRKRTASALVRAHYAVVLHAPEGEAGRSDTCQVLLQQQPPRGRWAGLWQPPGSESASPRADVEATLGPVLQHAEVVAKAEQSVVVHLLTHRRYEAGATAWLLAGPRPEPGSGQRWQTVRDALSKTGGVSRLGQRLIAQAWVDVSGASEPAEVAERSGPVSRRRRAQSES